MNFKEPVWARVELLGHKKYFGRIQEASHFGALGAEIEPMQPTGLASPFFVGGAAIYRVTPMTELTVKLATLPQTWRACDTFEASVVLPALCVNCGKDEPEHEAERQRRAALPPAPILDAEDGEDDIPFDGSPVSDDGPLSGALGH
jgi:hypothetical protein